MIFVLQLIYKILLVKKCRQNSLIFNFIQFISQNFVNLIRRNFFIPKFSAKNSDLLSAKTIISQSSVVRHITAHITIVKTYANLYFNNLRGEDLLFQKNILALLTHSLFFSECNIFIQNFYETPVCHWKFFLDRATFLYYHNRHTPT